MTSIRSNRNWLYLLIPAIIVFTLDQASKALVTSRLALGESWAPIPAVADIFKITNSANSGAAFSIFQGSNLPLLLLAVAMVGGIIWYYRQVPADHHLLQIAMGLLLGGVLGNAMDRFRFGTVVDFIHWQIPHLISNISNPADHAIVLAVLLLFLAQRQTVRYDAGHDKPEVIDPIDPTATPATAVSGADPERLHDGDSVR